MREVTGILHAPEQVCSVLDPNIVQYQGFLLSHLQQKTLNPEPYTYRITTKTDRHDIVVWMWFRV